MTKIKRSLIIDTMTIIVCVMYFFLYFFVNVFCIVQDPVFLGNCIICWEQDWDDCFEVHEFSNTKESLIFKVKTHKYTYVLYIHIYILDPRVSTIICKTGCVYTEL